MIHQLEQADCVEKGILPSPDVKDDKALKAPLGMWNAIFYQLFSFDKQCNIRLSNDQPQQPQQDAL